MTTILSIIQLFIVFCLVVVILVQKTSSDSLAGLSGGGHNVFSSKSSKNLFSKATMILGIAFMLNSLLIAKFHVSYVKSKSSISESLELDHKKAEPKVPEAPAATE